MESITNIDHQEIEKRKETMRRMWEYRPLDHIPIGVWIDDFGRYTQREQCEDGFKQFEVMVHSLNRSLKNLPDDYIPFVRVWPGYLTIATMFGMQTHWSEDPNQAPGPEGYLVENRDDIYKLPVPDAKNDGLMPHNLEWLDYAKSNLPQEVYLTGIDLGGPINTAKDLFETNLLYTLFIDSPEDMHYFLSLATEVQIRCVEEIVKAAGGLDRLTCTDFDPIWAPKQYKGFVSDDVCASFGPDIFEEFSIPYNNRIMESFEGGRLHNCGPNPSAHLYLMHDPKRFGLNCSYKYSKGDLPIFKREFSGKGIVEVNFDNGESAREICEGFEQIANELSPYVIGMPIVFLDQNWSDDDIRGIYSDLRKISERYAREILWAE
jgi:hypothetical protein